MVNNILRLKEQGAGSGIKIDVEFGIVELRVV